MGGKPDEGNSESMAGRKKREWLRDRAIVTFMRFYNRCPGLATLGWMPPPSTPNFNVVEFCFGFVGSVGGVSWMRRPNIKMQGQGGWKG